MSSAFKKSSIKVRWIICAISASIAYSFVASKISLSLAIVAMTDENPSNDEIVESYNQLNGTNLTDGNIIIEKRLNKHYINWTQSTNDKLLQAAFLGATISPIPAGRLSEKFGPRKIATGLIILCGVTMLMFPWAAETAFEAAFGLRVIQGLCVGCVMPCCHVLISHWAPKYEKTLMASIVTAGAMAGSVLTHPIAGQLCGSDFLEGWPSVFYLLGTINIIIGIIWFFVVADDPELHPFISDDEKQLILKERSSSSEDSETSIPWSAILKSSPVWALIISNFAYGWFCAIISGLVPSFFDSVLNISIEENGVLSALPYCAAIVSSIFFSYMADVLRFRGWYSTTAIRKFAADAGFILCSSFLMASTFFGKDQEVWVITSIIAAKAFGAAQVAGCYVMHLDITPTYAGSLIGIMETVQNLASMSMNQAAVYIVGDEPNIHDWSNFFLVTAGICIIGSHYFALLGSAKLQKWDPTFKSDEDALDDDQNGSEAEHTIFDPEIFFRDEQSGNFIKRNSSYSSSFKSYQ